MTDLDLFSYLEEQTAPVPSPAVPAITRARVTDPDTSQEAASASSEHLAKENARVLRSIAMHQGVSVEAATATRSTIATDLACEGGEVSRRITDLVEMGLVVDSGRRLPGRRNRPCTVWILTDAGRATWERMKAER